MESIRGTTPQDIGKLNTILLKLQTKVYSKLGFKDFDYNTQKKISTQLLPVSGVGNFDYNYPYNIFFYIPADKYKIIGAKFNFVAGKYRTDVDTQSDGSASSIYATDLRTDGTYYTSSNGSGDIMTASGGGGTVGVSGGYVTISNHRHDVSISSHTHSISSIGHRHTVEVTTKNHKHELVKAISRHSSDPSFVEVYLNNTKITTLTSSTLEKNNIEVGDLIKVGWNTIECSATTLARINLYGIIELSIK